MRPAASQRLEFIPDRLTLPGDASAAVLPATTVDGVLKVSTTTSQFQTETRVGLRMNDGGAARWNNLEVVG